MDIYIYRERDHIVLTLSSTEPFNTLALASSISMFTQFFVLCFFVRIPNLFGAGRRHK